MGASWWSRCRGKVYLVDPVAGTDQLWFTMDNVDQNQGRGLFDIVTHPSGDGTFYISYIATPGRRNRVAQFHMESTGAATKATGSTFIEAPGPTFVEDSADHFGGGLGFDSDGYLYWSLGDGATPASTHNLDTVMGSVLRVAPDGSAPNDNPFNDRDGVDEPRDFIWAIGFRNPFRLWVDPVTDRVWVGDVGSTEAEGYEEINVIKKGADYGWPFCEGPLSGPKVGPDCPAGITPPVHYYPHERPEGAAVNGGQIYRGSTFPLDGAYVFADFATGQFFWFTTDGQLNKTGEGTITEADGRKVVWSGVSPIDGGIYWLDFGEFSHVRLRRLMYQGSGNQPPTITTATADPTSGPAGTSVQFRGAAIDPEGDAISYRWNFGDGTSANGRNPTHVYTTNGVYNAVLRVTSGGVSRNSPPIRISIGTPPKAKLTLTNPPGAAGFRAGDALVFRGSATQGGVALPKSALSWLVEFVHNDHVHPIANVTGARGYILEIPTTGHGFDGNTRYRVTLTATNADGVTHSVSQVVTPQKVSQRITSNLDVDIVVDEITQKPPLTLDTVVGYTHRIDAPAYLCVGGRVQRLRSIAFSPEPIIDYVVQPASPLVEVLYDRGEACDIVQLLVTPSRAIAGADGWVEFANGTKLFVDPACRDRLQDAGLEWDVRPFREINAIPNHGAVSCDNLVSQIVGGPRDQPDFRCNGKPATIVGTGGADELIGSNGNDVIVALGGPDVVDARRGADLVCGGTGDDLLIGGKSADLLFGQGGHDRLIGQTGADRLHGGDERDRLKGGQGDDKLYGNRARDRLNGGLGNNDRCSGGKNRDTHEGGCEFITLIP